MIGTYLEQSIAHMRQNKINLLAGVITSTVSLLILGSVILVYVNIMHLSGIFFERSHYAIFVDPELHQAAKDAIVQRLQRLPQVDKVEERSPEEAKAELLQSFQEARPALEALDLSSLPYLLEFTLKNGRQLSPAQLKELQGLTGVQQVFVGREAKDQVSNFFTISNFIGIALILLLLISIAIIIRNSILLAVRIRYQEIVILKILGATGTYIRFPFMAEAVTMLMAGYSLSLYGLYFLYQFMLAGITFSPETYPLREMARFFTPWEMGLELAVLLAVALSASFYATNEILKQLEL